MATRYTIGYYFVISLFFNLPFIITNFFYSQGRLPSTCMQENSSLSISIVIWMKVNAVNQTIYLVGLMLAALLRLCTSDAKDCLLASATALVFFNGLLQGIWLIMGGVVFWGANNNICPAYFKAFMYCQIIGSFIGIIFTMVLSRKYFLESQYKEDEEEMAETQNGIHDGKSSGGKSSDGKSEN